MLAVKGTEMAGDSTGSTAVLFARYTAVGVEEKRTGPVVIGRARCTGASMSVEASGDSGDSGKSGDSGNSG